MICITALPVLVCINQFVLFYFSFNVSIPCLVHLHPPNRTPPNALSIQLPQSTKQLDDSPHLLLISKPTSTPRRFPPPLNTDATIILVLTIPPMRTSNYGLQRLALYVLTILLSRLRRLPPPRQRRLRGLPRTTRRLPGPTGRLSRTPRQRRLPPTTRRLPTPRRWQQPPPRPRRSPYLRTPHRNRRRQHPGHQRSR